MPGSTLRRCDRCRRHVRADDPRCPFCVGDARARGFATAVTLGATLGACGARDLPASETEATTTTSPSSMGPTDTVDTIDSADPTTASTTMPGTTMMMSETGPVDTGTSVADSSSSDGDDGGCQAGFYGGCPPDGGNNNLECDIWAQDCPRGEKCMPWANDGELWNATRCSPLDPDPAEVGEPCTVEGSGVSGIDDCTLGAMCWDVDPDANTGTCIDMCMGSEANPTCTDPETSCAIGYNGVLIVCLPVCDPLVQDCAQGQGCYLTNEEFLCQPVVGTAAGHGEPCSFVDSCEVGMQCIDGTNVADCEGLSCCTELCDLDAADPNEACSAAAQGETCIVLFDDGQFPNVGVCRLPD